MPSVAFTKVSEDTYRGTIYLDRMLDEDIYGNGICRWQIVQVAARLKATGAREETRFVASLSGRALASGKSETHYYWKHGYPVESIPDYPDHGQSERTMFKQEVQGELFSIKLSSEEIAR